MDHRTFWLKAGLCVLALGTHAVAGSLSEATAEQMKARLDRIDSYSMGESDPSVFRALTGMGDPHLKQADEREYHEYYSPYLAPPEVMADLRKLIPAVEGSSYPQIGRCRMAATLKILKERVQQFGEDHPYVAQWIATQRSVFSHCAILPQGASPTDIPPPLPTRDRAIARLQAQDRALQTASLLFYSDDREGALAAYQKIAGDKASPHRALATYMAVAIRAGTSDGWSRQPMVPSEQSLKEIDAILADPTLSSIHIITASLIGWIAWNSTDETSYRARIREVLTSLEAPLQLIRTSETARVRYSRAINDLNHFSLSAKRDDGEVTSMDLLAQAAKHDQMAAWITFPRDPFGGDPWVSAERQRESWDKAARNFLQRNRIEYQNTDFASPWLHVTGSVDIATLSAMVNRDITRVKAVEEDEPALAALPLDFHRLVRRLLTDKPGDGRHFAAALQRLEDFPFKESWIWEKAVEQSFQYLITKGYLTQARELRDRLHLDKTRPDDVKLHVDGLLVVLAEDQDHLVQALRKKFYVQPTYLNGVSIKVLWLLAARSELDPGQRALYARTAWTRSYALGRVIAKRNDRLMRNLNSEITANWHSPGGRVLPSDVRVLGDVLASPGMNIVMGSYPRMPGKQDLYGVSGLTGINDVHPNDYNWWCAWQPDRYESELADAIRYNFSSYTMNSLDQEMGAGGKSLRQLLGPAMRGSFVFRSIDKSELRALSKIDCAPRMLTQRVIAWVKNSGRFGVDVGQDEALANAVATTRWGCRRQSHAAYSKEAYELLHAKFPDSAAAKRTKYWFDCIGYGCPEKRPSDMLSGH